MVVTLSTTITSTSPIVADIPTSRRQLFYKHSNLFFNVSPKPKFRLFLSKPLPSRMVVVKAQLNKVATEGSNNAPATTEAKSGLPLQETTVNGPSKGFAAGVVSEESISEFMSQVSDLVKLVDSRDITELQLKQFDCEILIRKNLIVPPTQSHAPFVTMQSPPPMVSPPPTPPSRTPSPALPAPAAKSAKSSIPPVLSPMAGSFYRCPGPGEPPFVKVGDKVQKGQVLCIIEAMKLMNEIQAEQAGTVVEVIAEDGKPVSKDSPLFAIQP